MARQDLHPDPPRVRRHRLHHHRHPFRRRRHRPHHREPLFPATVHHFKVEITLVLIAALGAVFLKGFREAIDLAVGLVIVYLLLNAVVIAIGLAEIVSKPDILFEWQLSLFQEFGNPFNMALAGALIFPKLALGLSGFETGVAVMPQIKGMMAMTANVRRDASAMPAICSPPPPSS